MYLSDAPITSQKDDQLNRSHFAQRFGKALIEWKDEEGIAIGLYGSWGSGKSSLINLALDYIERKAKNIKKERKPIIIKFNPWNFTEQNSLITTFLNELAKSIQYQDHSAEAKRVGKELITYSKFFIPLSFIAPFPANLLANLFENVFKQVGEAAKDWGELKSKSVEDFKKELDKRVKGLGRKIIIIIDDIDRLNNTEIRQVFQLVKQNANFPNTVYVLSFDHRKVSKALDEDSFPGKDYLEKIIQVSFHVPVVEGARLEKILFAELGKVINPFPQKDWDSKRWGNLYYDGLKDFFSSIRQIKRYANSLRFNISHVPKEINPIDFIGIEVIRVFCSEVYEEIAKNKELFTACESTLDNRNDSERRRKQVEDILSKSEPKYKKSLRGVIFHLFPQVGGIFNNSSYTLDWQDTWNKQKSICATKRFDNYFFLTVSEGELSQQEIDSILSQSSNLSILEPSLKNLMRKGRIRRFLDRLDEFVDQVPSENIEIFIMGFFNISDNVPRIRQGMFDFGVDSQFTRLGYHFLKRIEDKQKRLEVFLRLIKNSKSLDVPTQIVYHEQERKKKSDEANRLFDDQGLDQIKVAIVEKIQLFANKGKLGSVPNLAYILFRWKEWKSEEEPKSFVQKLINNDKGMIQFLEGFMWQQSSQGMDDAVSITSWRSNHKTMQTFTEVQELKKRVKELPKKIKERLTKKQKFGLEVFTQEFDQKEW